MRYKKIDNQLFIKNRANFIQQLKPKSIAVFVANDEMPRSGDTNFLFRQDPDLFYLSGINQELTYLILFPDAPQDSWKEILFIRETNEHIAVWEGEKLTKEDATNISGIKNVLWNKDFENTLKVLTHYADNIYLNWNEHDRFDSAVETANVRLANKIKKLYPLHNYERSAPILHQLRAIKSEIEIDIIKQACHITEKAFRRVLSFIQPNIYEYEIEAEITHEFIRNGVVSHAYPPIIASGKNSCVLHYNTNHQICKDGDIVLMDFGAEYANYASDLTRTVPVNGKFTPRQKAVYQAVLNVMRFAKTQLVPGNNFDNYNKAVGEVMTEELIKLGLLEKEAVKQQNPDKPLYKKYFMHGTSHFMGIDVHDVGNKFLPFQAGMVFTCEPGIYIPEEEIGIRLENDLLITNNQPIDLMESIPIEIEEIESLMKK